jgi:cellulose synthase operon protein C
MLSVPSRFNILVSALAVAVLATGTGAFASGTKRKPAGQVPGKGAGPTAKPGAGPVTTGGELDSLKLIEGDETANEQRALKTEMMVSRSELKAIEQAEKLLRKYKGTPIEAELLFRLAELHMRRAKTGRFVELHRKSDTVIRVAPKLVGNANSRRSIESAVRTYESIQTRFPRFAQLDLVIFNNAFARQQLGQEREAERLYWSLIKSFGSSPLVPDSHLAIGEINFDRGNFSFALEHFNAIRKFTESRVYPYGLYKAAWSHFNLHEPLLGLKKLEEVVAYGKFVAEKKIESRLDLRKEALGDMTLFYEDVYPAKDAFAYFKKQASELDFGPTILKLAKLYEHHSRHEDRQVVLNDFIENIPDSPHVARIHSDLIWNYDAMKKKDLAVAQMEKLFALCREDSSWLKVQRRAPRNPKEADPRIECMNTLNDAAVKLASRWLKIWKKSPPFTDFADAAEKAFAVYLREPGSSKEVNEARFAYAELLFQRQKFRPASAQYALVSKDPKAGALRHEASYAAVLSFEKGVGDKWSDADEKTFQELARSYIDGNPRGQYRVDVEFKLALIAYEKSRYDEAAPIFLRLGREFAKTEKGKKSQDLYLDILNLKKDYKALKVYARELMVAESDPARKAKLQKIHEQSYFLEVQGLEEGQKYEAAIAGYKEFAAHNSGTELAEKALWNALQLHFKIFDFTGGAQAAEHYYDRYPTTKNGMDALLKAAQSYESMGQLEPAADILVKIAKADPKNANKWHALAADFYLLSNRVVRAKKYLTDLRQTGDAKTRAESLDKLLMLEKAAGGGHAYKELLQTVAASGVQPQASLAKAELVEDQYKSGQQADAFNEAKKVVGMSQGSSYAKARARMIQAKVLEDEFLRQSVKSRAEKVATVLAIKTEKLEKAQQAFQQTIKYGEPATSVESLRRLAGCYVHYVDALKNMPLPSGLTKEDEAGFRDEISKLAIPLEEKAIETLQEGLKAAKRLRIEGPVTAEMRDALKKMNMPAPITDEFELSEPAMAIPILAGVSL